MLPYGLQKESTCWPPMYQVLASIMNMDLTAQVCAARVDVCLGRPGTAHAQL